MEKRLVLILLSFVFASALYAQTDTTRNLTLKKSDTLSMQNEGSDFLNQYVQKVDVDDIPSDLKKTLSQKDQYKGWENQTLYYDSQNKIYLLEKKEGITTHIYRFNKEGKPITGMLNEDDDQ
ncbi:hypothetical protein [Chryseosolibacter indicus]|uniref:Beta-lactamase-inhibitor-like PepSY-like domain-containing protein n=1 Tax=Chryseosolibacter indicus TaxID=2782351 RepID=A0ABS5VLA7_9BACT|nr:hypothetical protein [Chryseosolibacter indicus]MBT1702237.1 hypothetical protein [Chryseosolibacter indicus]